MSKYNLNEARARIKKSLSKRNPDLDCLEVHYGDYLFVKIPFPNVSKVKLNNKIIFKRM